MDILVQNIVNNTDKYLNTKGVFILVAIIENSKHADTLINHLTQYSSVIAEKSKLKGVKLLQDLLN